MTRTNNLFLLNDEELSIFIQFFHSFEYVQLDNTSIETYSGSQIIAQVHTFESGNRHSDSFKRFYIAKIPRRKCIQDIQVDIWTLSSLKLDYDECGILLFQQNLCPEIARMILIDLTDVWIPINFSKMKKNSFLGFNENELFKILHSNKKIVKGKFINNNTLRDTYYLKLIEEINTCYHRRAFTAVSILSRKLIENLLIDILRSKYGIQPQENLSKYYDISKRSHKRYSDLVSIFWNNFDSDFKNLSNLTSNTELRNIETKMKQLRRAQNAASHSVEIIRERDDIDTEKLQIQEIFDFLCRIYYNLNG